MYNLPCGADNEIYFLESGSTVLITDILSLQVHYKDNALHQLLCVTTLVSVGSVCHECIRQYQPSHLNYTYTFCIQVKESNGIICLMDFSHKISAAQKHKHKHASITYKLTVVQMFPLDVHCSLLGCSNHQLNRSGRQKLEYLKPFSTADNLG